MTAKKSTDKRFKLRYVDTLLSSCCKEEQEDNIDLWPSITYVYVCMFTILYPTPYTQDDMLNYKSLKSFNQF